MYSYSRHHHFSTMRSTTTTTTTATTTRDLKQRIITNLNKLSDRDTYTLAVTELESIAQTLTHHDSLSIYLNCLYYTEPTQKSPVRKQCAKLLALLAQLHGDDLSPFLSKMIANIIKRLRDTDSSVRSILTETVSVMASQITKPPFSAFLKPLMEAISVEQDLNSQIGSAMCLAAAIEAAPDVDVAQLERVVPKLLKLLKGESFKAKAALLTLIKSAVNAGGVSGHNLVLNLVPSVTEFLSSEDWAARKAAAEVLERLARVDKELVSEFKTSSLSTFESKRFDKVKGVREAMSLMLEAWRDVPGGSDEVSGPSHSKSSSKENGTRRGLVTPQSRKFKSPVRRSTPPDRSSGTSVRQRSPRKNSESKLNQALFRKLDRKKPQNVEVAAAHTPSKIVCDDGHHEGDKGVAEIEENEGDRLHKLGTRRALFNRNGDRFGGLKSGSRVVPLQTEDCLDSNVVASNNTEGICGDRKNNEDLSLIRKQLLQIENQQSSLLDLFQRFMGSSQNGMQSLETRVHGLEVTLDEISYDLAVTMGRISNPESGGNTCCKLPGAEFLSSKFWKKSEGRYTTPRFSTSLGSPLRASLRNMSNRDGSAESLQMDNRRFCHQVGGGLVVNPLADISIRPRDSSDIRLNRLPRTSLVESNGRKVGNNVHGVASTSAAVDHRVLSEDLIQS